MHNVNEQIDLLKINYRDAFEIVFLMTATSIILPYLFVAVGLNSPFIFALSGAAIISLTPLSIYKKLNKISTKKANVVKMITAIICFLFFYFAVRYNIIF